MPISGSTLAPTPARLGLMRIGAARLKYTHFISIATVVSGISANAVMRPGSVSIRDELNDVPNTCSFVNNAAVHVGNPVSIARLTTTLFSGVIERTTQRYEGEDHANLAWDATCQDFTRLLNRRLVTKHYDEQSATAILTDLAAMVPGVGIFAPGLPTVVGGIEFVDVDIASAVTQVMQRVGGYWYIDYVKVLRAFLTDTGPVPDALTTTTASLMNDPPVTYEEDQSQIRTRVIVTGGGSSALVPVRLGQTVIPIEDASWYADSGLLRVKTMRLAYSAVYPGGGSANVASGISGPGGAPSVALSTTVGGSIVGTVSYEVSFASAAGETLPSGPSSTVTGVVFAVPTSAPSLTTLSGIGHLIGTFGYGVTNINSRGETTIGPVTSITTSAVSAPSTPSASEVSSTMGVLIGTFNYKVSGLTTLGETSLSSATAITVAAQSAPSAPATDGSFGPGPIIGTISYKVSFVAATGDETMGTATSNFTPTVVTASSPTVSGDGTGVSIAYAVTYVHPVYGESALSARTVDTNKGANPVVSVVGLPSGCGWNVYSTGVSSNPSTDPLYKVAEMPIGASSFTHTTQTGPQEGVIATMGRFVTVSSLPQGPTGTVARRIWRTRAGGSSYYLVGQIDNNSSGVSFVDVVPDNALTTFAPIINLNGKQIALTVPTGTSGIVIARRIWRTKAGGSAYYLIGRIDDNTTTAWTDNIPDGSLTVGAPLAADAGGQRVQVFNIPQGPTNTLARRIWRTRAGGSEYFLLGQISNNAVGQTFDDDVLDSQLGQSAPLVNTAGASAVNVTLPSPPDSSYSRRLWRTEGGGTLHRFVAEIRDPAVSTYVDTKSDNELGDAAPQVATLGAVAGSTSLTVNSTADLPSAGWARVESQLISWTGKTSSTLTGIPQTGIPGGTPRINGARAIGATSLALDGLANGGTYKAGDSLRLEGQAPYYDVQSDATANGSGQVTVTVSPGLTQAVSDNALVSKTNLRGALLTGVSAGSAIITVPLITGVSGLTTAIAQGDGVDVLVERNDVAAQSALAASEGGGDGVVEFPIHDSTLTARTAAATGDAELLLYSRPIGTLRYATRDIKTHSGADVAVNIPSLGLNRSFTIQSVTIGEIGIAGGTMPLFMVQASTVKFSLADALRRLL